MFQGSLFNYFSVLYNFLSVTHCVKIHSLCKLFSVYCCCIYWWQNGKKIKKERWWCSGGPPPNSLSFRSNRSAIGSVCWWKHQLGHKMTFGPMILFLSYLIFLFCLLATKAWNFYKILKFIYLNQFRFFWFWFLLMLGAFGRGQKAIQRTKFPILGTQKATNC